MRDAPLPGATRPPCEGEMDVEAGEVGSYEDGGSPVDTEPAGLLFDWREGSKKDQAVPVGVPPPP